MGYRSEVAIELMRPDYENLKEIFASRIDVYPLLDWADIYERKADESDYVVTLHWNSIKWYGDECFEIMDEFLDSVPYHKSVVGEDIEDAEESSSDDWSYDFDEVYVERRIVGWDAGKRLNAAE